MGLFSKTRTFIESASSLLMDETPNMAADTIQTAVLNNRDISSDLVSNYLGSLHMKGRQLRAYAKKHYTYGLPDGTLNYTTPKNDLVRVVLKNLTGNNVYILHNLVDVADAYRFALPYLEQTRGYNETTGIVSNPPLLVPAPVGAVTLGVCQFMSNTSIQIEYLYTDNFGNKKNHYEMYSLGYVAVNEVYYHTVYYPVDARGDFLGGKQYWYYRVSLNDYPALNIGNQIVEESQYYPIVPIRQNKVNLTSDAYRDTELYKTSRRVLNFWNIQLRSLGDAVHQSPDINDVDHAYVVVGADIQDDNKYSLAYFHEYFNYLSLRSKVTQKDYLYWQANNTESPPPVNTVTISDGNYKMTLNYHYIETSIYDGTIGDEGFIKREVDTGRRVSTENYSYEQSSYALIKQLSGGKLHKVTVYGMYHINYVYPNDTVDTSLRDAMEDSGDKNNFIIPINVDVADNLGLFLSNGLMYYAIRVVFNSKITKKLKWYETGFFKLLTVVVAVVLTAYGLANFGAQIAAAAAAGATAVAQVVLQSVLLAVAVNVGVDFLVNTLGLEAAFLVILISTATAFATGNPQLDTLGKFKLPTALDMLTVVLAMNSSLQSQVQDAVSDVYGEYQSFLEEADALLAEIEETSANHINPYSLNLFSNSMGGYETPEEFLSRTTYNDDIGVLSIESVSTFNDRMLELDLPTNEIRTQI